jgi:SAM-dependent methyltransferase
VDVGCGTGISSRLFAERGIPVLGIEPNDEMRRQAEAAGGKAGYPSPIYRSGTAEQTELPDVCADAVLAAQAFHWFASDAALREFQRIVKPGGWVVLMWNERDERDPGTAEFGRVIGSSADAAALEVSRSHAGQVLLSCPLFQGAARHSFTNEQALAEEGLLGRAFSASYAPREPSRAEAFAAELRQVFARWQRDGLIRLQYETSVYLARSNLPPPV